jgi:hypothetical protein
MSEVDTLHRMDEARLRAWLLARMRGVEEDPPVSEMHMESPDDYVAVAYEQSRSKAFRARLGKAVVAAIEEAAKGKLRGGRDARAIRYLAELADSLELDAAAPVLHALAERGALGGHDDALDHEAEELVLFALAGLQDPGVLFAKWLALWQRDLPHLWPVVTAGLRLSDPKRALVILPQAVRRGASHPGFPYGEVLWAYATDERYAAGDFAAALTGLPREALLRCRDALRSLGATDAELAAWVPAPRPRAYPRVHFAEAAPLLARERLARYERRDEADPATPEVAGTAPLPPPTAPPRAPRAPRRRTKAR